MRRLILCLGALVLSVGAATACSLCGAGYRSSPTFRQEAGSRMAKMILHGTLGNPRLKGDGLRGETDFDIKSVIRDGKALDRMVTSFTVP